MRFAVTASFAFSLIFFLTSSARQATAFTGPDNTYCGAGNVSKFGAAPDGPAALPHQCIYTALAATPSPGTVRLVPAGSDLQAVLDKVQCGDTVALQAGATFTGNFYLPGRACDDRHWITIRTSAPNSSLPPEGSRLTPCYSGVSSFPGRPALHCAVVKNVTARIVYPRGGGTSGPLNLLPGANHYRLIGLELTRAQGSGGVINLIWPYARSTPHHIIVDRSWLHGTTHDDTARGLYLRGMSFAAAIDSYFSDFHCAVKGKCTDSQAIAGAGVDISSGAIKIVNNYLEASAENILFGAATASHPPSDIEIRRNHLFKPMTWLKGQPGFVGGTSGTPFVVKNHFELKNAQRVLFEGNVLENNWGGFSQHGFSIVLTPKNQNVSGVGTCPMCQVTDVTVRYSRVSHSGAGVNLATTVDSLAKAPALAGARFSIHDITLDDLNKSKYTGSGTLFLLLNTWASNALRNVTIDHVTGFPDPLGHVLSIGNPSQYAELLGLEFTNNIVGTGRYPVWSAMGAGDCSSDDVPLKVLEACFSGYIMRKNVLVSTPFAFPPRVWPTGNYFSSSLSTIGFLTGTYILNAVSPYNSSGTDGRDLGADIAAILKYTAGVAGP
jgi:hypothetical protein